MNMNAYDKLISIRDQCNDLEYSDPSNLKRLERFIHEAIEEAQILSLANPELKIDHLINYLKKDRDELDSYEAGKDRFYYCIEDLKDDLNGIIDAYARYMGR
jgi:uncharacterized protein YehS (DUF1456 family)